MEILDLTSNTCLCSSERRALDPNGCGPRFNTHSGNILLLDFFCFHVIKPLMPLLPFSATLWKSRMHRLTWRTSHRLVFDIPLLHNLYEFVFLRNTLLPELPLHHFECFPFEHLYFAIDVLYLSSSWNRQKSEIAWIARSRQDVQTLSWLQGTSARQTQLVCVQHNPKHPNRHLTVHKAYSIWIEPFISFRISTGVQIPFLY